MLTSRHIIIFLLACAMATVAGADEPGKEKSYRLFGQLTSYIELNQAEDDDDDEDYTKFKQLVSFNVEWSKFTVGAQAEYLYYSDPDAADSLDLDRLREGFELRKYYLDYTNDWFDARLGTFFSSLGRGMTLYVQKNDTLKLDEPIHGAMATATLKNFDITLLGGKVTEPILQNLFSQEFEDKVYGGRILARLPANLYLGGSYVRSELDRFYPAGVDDVDVWAIEGGGSSIAGIFDIHGEWADIEKTESNRFREGYGRYFSVVSYIGPVSILGEYKDYYNFQYRYNSPPNAGRENEAYTHDDVKGPRLMVTADLFSLGAIVHGSYAVFDSHKERTSPGGEDGNEQIEWYFGLEESVGRVYFEASYFDRDWTDLGIQEKHTLADFHLTVGHRGEIILGYDERSDEASYYSLSTTRTFLSYSLSQKGSLSLRHSWEDRGSAPKEDFWGAEVQWLPMPTMTVTVFGGSDPGGLVCAGGQCREEPRFKGLKGTFTWRF